MNDKRYKTGDEIFAISNDDVPEIKMGRIIDRDFSIEPPTYAIMCHGNNIQFIAESIDILKSYDDLQERYINVLKGAQRHLCEKIEQIENLLT